jgi:methionyl aminopeptidase
MSLQKTENEIELMRQGGLILSKALGKAVKAVKPGIKIQELDKIAENEIRAGGGEPSFLNYCTPHDQCAFPSSLCVSINDEVVHGPANRDIKLQEGDIVGLDVGCKYEGLYTDMAVTVPVGKVSKEAEDLMTATKQSLLDAISVVQGGGKISDIGKAVEKSITPNNYGIVKQLVGHGVGHEVHEDPRIPNFYDPAFDKQKIVVGQCLAIEPMITTGDWVIETKNDGWTAVTSDGSLAAHFEVTLAVTESGPEILTPLPV